MATKTRKVYYHTNTENVSFLKMYRILKDLGIEKCKFHLKLYDKDLAYINPHDPNLTTAQKAKVINEIKRNFWYFAREVVRIPVSGGVKGYEIHRGNLAMSWCVLNNINTIIELPRQNYKSISACVLYLWIYNYATVNSEIALLNKKYDDSKMNLRRIKEIRDELPDYLRLVDERNDKNNLTYLESSLTSNKLVAKPTAIDESGADQLGRGCTQPCQWYDEFAFLKFNDIVYASATPAQSQAALEAKANSKPYHKLITTTPGDLKNGAGVYAKKFFDRAAMFDEKMYDWKKKEIEEYIKLNSKNNFVYIEFSYKQLGRSEEWFEQQCRDLDQDWFKIRREILLQWNKSSDVSPFTEEQIERLYKNVRDPVATLPVCKYYMFNLYKDFDWRKTLIIGVDVSGGMSRDGSAITIADGETLEILADFNNNVVDCIDLAEILVELCTKFFTNGPLVIERNSYGKDLIDFLLRTPIANRLYYEIKKTKAEKKVVDVKHQHFETRQTRVYGVNTDTATRPQMIDLLRHIVNDEYDKLNSKRIVDDIAGLERKKGKIEHGDITHDDNLFSYLVLRWVYAYGRNLSHFFIHKRKFTRSVDGEQVEEMGTSYTNQLIAIANMNKKTEGLGDLTSERIIEEFYARQKRIDADRNEPGSQQVDMYQNIFNFNKWA